MQRNLQEKINFYFNNKSWLEQPLSYYENIGIYLYTQNGHLRCGITDEELAECLQLAFDFTKKELDKKK